MISFVGRCAQQEVVAGIFLFALLALPIVLPCRAENVNQDPCRRAVRELTSALDHDTSLAWEVSRQYGKPPQLAIAILPGKSGTRLNSCVGVGFAEWAVGHGYGITHTRETSDTKFLVSTSWRAWQQEAERAGARLILRIEHGVIATSDSMQIYVEIIDIKTNSKFAVAHTLVGSTSLLTAAISQVSTARPRGSSSSSVTMGLKHCFEFDGPNDALTSATGTLVGAPRKSDGIVGNSYRFNGTTDYLVYLPAMGNVLAGDFTVSLWFRATGRIPKNSDLLRKRVSGAGNGLEIQVRSDNRIYLVLDTGRRFILDQPFFWCDGRWHLLVAVRKGSTLHMWIDDGLRGNLKVSGRATNRAPVFLASDRGIGGFFEGDIDELTMWDRALDSVELSFLWNNGLGRGYPYGNGIQKLTDTRQSPWDQDKPQGSLDIATDPRSGVQSHERDGALDAGKQGSSRLNESSIRLFRGLESGIVLYKYTGLLSGTAQLSFDKWGARRHTFERKSLKGLNGRLEEKMVTILNSSGFYQIDEASRSAYRLPSPLLPDRVLAEYPIFSPALGVAEAFVNVFKVSTERVLGYECAVVLLSYSGVEVRLWLWDGLPLKAEWGYGGLKMGFRATQIIKDPSLTDSTFELARGIKVIEVTDTAWWLRGMSMPKLRWPGER